MTREAAIKTFREDYCGEKFFCELHQDGLCNTEDCEIWCAIKALETQPDGDAVSRQDAIRIVDSIDTWQAGWRGDAIESLKALPPAQPEITPDGTLTVSIDADIANVGRILLSQAGTQYGGLYYKDAQPEIIMCKDCKHYRKEHGWNCIEYMVCAISPIHTVIRKPDDFCSRAKRKE